MKSGKNKLCPANKPNGSKFNLPTVSSTKFKAILLANSLALLSVPTSCNSDGKSIKFSGLKPKLLAIIGPKTSVPELVGYCA